jgi:hypothetical protein
MKTCIICGRPIDRGKNGAPLKRCCSKSCNARYSHRFRKDMIEINLKYGATT